MMSTSRQCSDTKGFVSEQGPRASPQSDLVARGHHLILPGLILFFKLKVYCDIYINESQELLRSMRILIKRKFSFLPLRSPPTNPLLLSVFVIISASHWLLTPGTSASHLEAPSPRDAHMHRPSQ